jgi:2-phosphosulfolactate phosphatase
MERTGTSVIEVRATTHGATRAAPAGALDVDVALVPSLARGWAATVCLVIDQLRASTTIVTLLDLGCSELLLTAGLAEARRLRRERGSLLAGERRGLTPRGFQANNSPAELLGMEIRGRSVVLSSSNGTLVLSRLVGMPATLVACLANARASAEAAVDLARGLGVGVGVVCAGLLGRFTLDDAYAAGVVVERLVDAARVRGMEVRLRDGAWAAMRLRSAYPDAGAAFAESRTGQLVRGLGAEADLELCARVDVSDTVPVLRPGPPLQLERLERR